MRVRTRILPVARSGGRVLAVAVPRTPLPFQTNQSQAGLITDRRGGPLTGRLNSHSRSMTKALTTGVHSKRNRRPTGTKAVEKKIYLATETLQELEIASDASGQLSLSLYLELLTARLKAEYGKLPVLSPTLPHMESRIDSAA
jgi:hypothetical protein